ncbi:hypothetical protein LMG28614_02060 [Paraburkholderia ultramafica]|uniref:N-acetyltransferase domain-containing protein n=1 Tax=Paraburkholderia ultramafica TaxID=1544867 RepID=A0A6S7B4D7_9BURK|nr:GNAT family N-acetyltransferase [Paraburkholderia ultramafica]CAB3785145.1 hypothetical protein LMG28614_02060 [Paraburkholderia ultramafica]
MRCLCPRRPACRRRFPQVFCTLFAVARYIGAKRCKNSIHGVLTNRNTHARRREARIATVATQLAIEYAFSVLNLRKIYLIVDKSNTAAIHIYEKCGFRHEAELIEEFFGNGRYHNALRMRMFQSEFFNAGERAE